MIATVSCPSICRDWVGIRPAQGTVAWGICTSWPSVSGTTTAAPWISPSAGSVEVGNSDRECLIGNVGLYSPRTRAAYVCVRPRLPDQPLDLVRQLRLGHALVGMPQIQRLKDVVDKLGPWSRPSRQSRPLPTSVPPYTWRFFRFFCSSVSVARAHWDGEGLRNSPKRPTRLAGLLEHSWPPM